FASAVVISVAAFAAFGGFLFLNTLYLQQARGLSPLHAGLATLPLALATVVAAPLSGRLVGRHGARVALPIAGVCIAAACAALTELSPDIPLERLFAVYVVFGIGFGFVNTPTTHTGASGMLCGHAGVS